MYNGNNIFHLRSRRFIILTIILSERYWIKTEEHKITMTYYKVIYTSIKHEIYKEKYCIGACTQDFVSDFAGFV